MHGALPSSGGSTSTRKLELAWSNFCKVKAHASMRDVADELTTWTDRAANNAADQAEKAALVARKRQTRVSNAWTSWSPTGWATVRRWPKCATKRATQRERRRLLGRAQKSSPILGRWLLVIIFQVGSVLMVSGAVHGAPLPTILLRCWNELCAGAPSSWRSCSTPLCVACLVSSACNQLTICRGVETGSGARGVEGSGSGPSTQLSHVQKDMKQRISDG